MLGHINRYVTFASHSTTLSFYPVVSHISACIYVRCNRGTRTRPLEASGSGDQFFQGIRSLGLPAKGSLSLSALTLSGAMWYTGTGDFAVRSAH